MGIGYGPRVVTDGLVLALDAADVSSYPGSGTTWTDLSGNGNNGTLVNGVGYSGGSLSFDGVNDYVNIPYSDLKFNFADTVSVCVWAKISPNGDKYGTLVTQRTNVGTGFQTYVINSKLYADGGSVNPGLYGTTTIPTDSIFFATFIFNKSDSTLKIFKDAVFESQTTYPGTIQDTYPIRIGNGAFGDGPFPGNISQVSIYNKALTASEIQQNFNALRGRFGI